MQHGEPPRRGAEGGGGLDKGFLLDGPRLGVDHAGEPRPVGDREREDHVGQRRAQGLGDRDGEHHLRDGEEDVGDPHQRVAGPAVVVAGHQADRHADDQRGAHRDEADEDRDARPEEQTAVDVRPHAVGAEPVGAARGPEALGGVQLEDVVGVRGQQRGQQRGQHQQRDEQEPDQSRPVPPQPRQNEPRRAHISPLRAPAAPFDRLTWRAPAGRPASGPGPRAGSPR